VTAGDVIVFTSILGRRRRDHHRFIRCLFLKIFSYFAVF
jgi:hypothetical protein